MNQDTSTYVLKSILKDTFEKLKESSLYETLKISNLLSDEKTFKDIVLTFLYDVYEKDIFKEYIPLIEFLELTDLEVNISFVKTLGGIIILSEAHPHRFFYIEKAENPVKNVSYRKYSYSQTKLTHICHIIKEAENMQVLEQCLREDLCSSIS